MRELFRVLWTALLLLIVALVSALVAMRLAIHGHEVKVPDFLGDTPAEAHQMAEGAGLNERAEREYYSASVPQGRVLSQTPDPGTTVRRGWDVRLALSLGPQRVNIPQVVGQSERAAGIMISERGLDIASTANVQFSGTPSGQVIAQDPPANANDISSPKVNLLVTQNTAPEDFVTPSFIGEPLGTVNNTLKNAGFTLGKVTVTDTVAIAPNVQSTGPLTTNVTPSPAAIIVSQDPPPGDRIVAGSAVNFVVR